MEVDDRFDGMARLLGRPGAVAVQRSHVCVIGLGGVGSWTAEALARSGVGALTLVDLDEICVSNVNRQLHTVDSTVGRLKVEVMAERVRGIHPSCDVRVVDDFFAIDNAGALLAGGYDFVVDAIDVPPLKALLVAMCRERELPVVVAGGTGGRVDPTAIVVGDLNLSKNDGLLRSVRKALRQQHGFPRHRKPWNIPAVFSDELPVYPAADGGVCDRPDPEQAPRRLDCATGYGAASFVTGTFGFVAAAVVVQGLVAAAQEPKRSS